MGCSCRRLWRQNFKTLPPETAAATTTCLRFSCGFDDLREAARIEAGATDECAVDVLLRHEFSGVFRLHAAAVLNTNALGRGRVGKFAENAADKGVRFLRLLRGRVFACADGPDRLIGDHGFL